MTKDIEKFLNQDIIVRFIDWNDSKCKEDYDLMFSFQLTIEGQNPNFLFLEDGPALIRIYSFQNNDVIFFNHRDKIFYSRKIHDIKEIKNFIGQANDINDYLKNNPKQAINRPTFNPVFKNDPSGVFGSLEAKRFCLSFAIFMQKLMAINLCANESVLYDENVYIKVDELIGLKSDSNNTIKLIEKIVNQFKNIYDIIQDRGILYRDAPYVKFFNPSFKVPQPQTGCFIATAVYGSPYANQVIAFKQFRDNYLSGNVIGKLFIRWYYRFSPFLATKIEENEKVKKIIRKSILNPLHSIIRLTMIKSIR